MRALSLSLALAALSGLGCWEMLPASRDPMRDAQHREPGLCGRGPQQYPVGLFDPQSVVSVEPLYVAQSQRGSQDQRLLGATLGIRVPSGVSSEELERLLNCHAVRSQLGSEGEPVIANDPYWAPGHVVHVSVQFDEGETHVQIRARDVAGAQAILKQAMAFRAAAAPASPPVAAVFSPVAPASSPESLDEISIFAAFHAKRLERLRATDGWLTLVGLLWLKEGDNPVGAAEKTRLPEGWPARLGVFTKHGDRVSLAATAGVSMLLEGKPFVGGEIAVTAEGESEPLVIDGRRLTVIRRGERFGLRLRDPGSPVRAALRDIPAYPPNAGWRLTARFEPGPPGHTLDIQNVLGQVQATPSPGTAVFEIGRKTYRLSPVLDDPDHLFFVFGDLTNADATYGAGRFLTAELPRDGQVVLDFNQAVNPPCAFTAFATCPIPPKENRLPIRVEAGELRVGEHAE